MLLGVDIKDDFEEANESDGGTDSPLMIA